MKTSSEQDRLNLHQLSGIEQANEGRSILLFLFTRISVFTGVFIFCHAILNSLSLAAFGVLLIAFALLVNHVAKHYREKPDA